MLVSFESVIWKIVNSSKTSPTHNSKQKSAFLIPTNGKNITKNEEKVDDNYKISKNNNPDQEKSKIDSNSKMITLNLNTIQKSNDSKLVYALIIFSCIAKLSKVEKNSMKSTSKVKSSAKIQNSINMPIEKTQIDSK